MKKHILLTVTCAASLLASACVVTPTPTDPAKQPAGATTAPPPRATDVTSPSTTTPSTTTPSTTTPTDTSPPDDRVVRDWRRGRLGSAARFSIEPSIGPAGTVVNIYGVFRPRTGGAVMCTFTGAEPVSPYFVSVRRMVVRVPDNAQSGAASCAVQNESIWRGRFIVTARVDDIFVPANEEEGVLGAVYRIPQGTNRLPNFETLGDPIGTFVVPTIHVSPRDFDRGFPGVETDNQQVVREWYALRYVGLVDATAAAEYTFKVKASDGARLYIDDQLVVDNDGVHPPQDREGKVQLTQGKHRLVVEYFKAAGAKIALELWWKRGNNPFSGVAKHSLSRYSVEYDCSVQPVSVMCCQAMTPACQMCAERQRAAMAAWQNQCRRP